LLNYILKLFLTEITESFEYQLGWNLSWMVLLMDLIGSMESEIQRLLEENNKLKNICNETVFSPEYFIDNNEKVKYYTGLPNYNVLMAVCRLLEHHIPITDRSSLSKFQQLILTLIKLRLSLSVQDISYRFKVSIPTVSRVFFK
jgi:hypothetical protein